MELLYSIKREINGQINYSINSFTDRVKVIMFSAFIWGIFAHGFMLFNKFSFHDDIVLLTGMRTEGLISQGRWGMAFFVWILNKAFIFDYSLPAFKGLSAIFLMGVFWIALSNWLELKNRLGLILISGIMIVCSTMASSFGYMFSSPFLAMQLIFSLVSCNIICKAKTILELGIGICICTFTIGIYQIGFVYILSLFILFMIHQTLNERYSDKEFFLSGLRYLIISIISLVLYLAVNQIVLWLFNIKMTEYYGLNRMGIVSAGEYLKRAVKAYITFFLPNRFTYGNAYPRLAEILYWMIIFVLFIYSFCCMLHWIKVKKTNIMMQFTVLMFLFPVTTELLVVLSPAVYVHSMFTQNFVYVLLFLIIEKNFEFRFQGMSRLKMVIAYSCFGVFLLLNIIFCQFDNACYLKANMLQEHAISYFNNLITRIQMVEGYTEETPIYFSGGDHKKEIDSVRSEFDVIEINPYDASSLSNNYVWYTFMENWCNFKQPVINNPYEYFSKEELDGMPIYPDDGGVKMINGIIVVRFSEEIVE